MLSEQSLLRQVMTIVNQNIPTWQVIRITMYLNQQSVHVFEHDDTPKKERLHENIMSAHTMK